MIEFKKEAKEVVEYFINRYDAQANSDIKAVEYVNAKIIEILKEDERYGNLLKANGKILRIINKLRDSIKLWEEYEELSKQEELNL